MLQQHHNKLHHLHEVQQQQQQQQQQHYIHHYNNNNNNNMSPRVAMYGGSAADELNTYEALSSLQPSLPPISVVSDKFYSNNENNFPKFIQQQPGALTPVLTSPYYKYELADNDGQLTNSYLPSLGASTPFTGGSGFMGGYGGQSLEGASMYAPYNGHMHHPHPHHHHNSDPSFLFPSALKPPINSPSSKLSFHHVMTPPLNYDLQHPGQQLQLSRTPLHGETLSSMTGSHHLSLSPSLRRPMSPGDPGRTMAGYQHPAQLQLNGDGEEINTREVAQKIGSELKRYSIPQAVFAQQVLCRSQGTLSDLLRNPKPWSKLKSGRETFRRMWLWLQEPEFQRMASLRLAGRMSG